MTSALPALTGRERFRYTLWRTHMETVVMAKAPKKRSTAGRGYKQIMLTDPQGIDALEAERADMEREKGVRVSTAAAIGLLVREARERRKGGRRG
jgi:hypothetical protein